MKNQHLQTSSLWKKGTTLTLGLGLLSGGMSTQAATDCNAVTEISAIECESLLELYHSTNGAEWKYNEGWNVTNTPCSWHGVTCENGVTKIDLSDNKLTGAIPDFRALPNLQKLYLDKNQLTGMIPDFRALPKLQKLHLDKNQLTGMIPDFRALPNLQELHLDKNQLTGMIPDFRALLNLVSFNFGGNKLTLRDTNCNAVTQIAKVECESLLELYHSTNGAKWKNNEGWNVTNLPCSWKGVTCENGGVTLIQLFANQLTGTIPDFSALPQLVMLWLSDNKLTGAIPDFSALPQLQYLFLWNNQLTGAIPDFSALPKLEQLYLFSNKLTGTIPDFSALPNLQYLLLFDNKLTGAIPDFSALPKLGGLSLTNNQLTGAIPDFSALPKLKTLDLSDNKLCKDTNINYSSWQEEVNAFPNCPVSPAPTPVNGSLKD